MILGERTNVLIHFISFRYSSEIVHTEYTFIDIRNN